MQTQFTLHCIPWQARAPMLQQVRALACEIGLLSRSEAQTDLLPARPGVKRKWQGHGLCAYYAAWNCRTHGRFAARRSGTN